MWTKVSPLVSALVLLIMLVVAASIYDFVNGFQDSANVVATMIASRALSARGALLLAAAGTLAGPFVIGVAVARTVGSEVLSTEAITVAVAMAALLAATVWNLAAWYFSVPVSSSHALVGGLLGAGLHEGGAAAVQTAGIVKVAVSLLVSPVLGFVVALAIMHATLWALRKATPHANVAMLRGQVSSTQVVSLAIVGAGAAERRSKVRWALLGDIAWAWVLTVPTGALIAMPLHAAISLFLRRGGA